MFVNIRFNLGSANTMIFSSRSRSSKTGVIARIVFRHMLLIMRTRIVKEGKRQERGQESRMTTQKQHESGFFQEVIES